MPYGEINYQKKVGNSKFTIAEIGCFITADCNLLEKIGVHIDPGALDAFYEAHNLFTYDLTDKANDDITWNTVTKYHPQLVAGPVQAGGFPNTDLAIVEFHYKSHTGAKVTHFCAVNKHFDQSIIDSYDGKVKTPAQYQSIYGHPVAWAAYTNHVAVSPPPPPPAVHTVVTSAPLAVIKPAAPAPPPPPTTPTRLFLPPSVWIWHVYKEGGPWTIPHAIGALDPKMYGGLWFDILGNPAKNIYIIQTQSFGRVAIYAGPDTVAQFQGGHGEGEPTQPPTDTTGEEVVPAPEVATVGYVPFTEPMNLVTQNDQNNKPPEIFNFVTGENRPVHVDQAFTAVGKATASDGKIYFMDADSFGDAGSTGVPTVTEGISTVNLGEAPTDSDEPQTVPVRVADFKESYNKYLSPQTFEANQTLIIHDLAGEQPDRELVEGQPIVIAGSFKKGGDVYLRSKNSVDSGHWYGVPEDAVRKPGEQSSLDQAASQASSAIKNEGVISKAATANGLAQRFLHRNK